MYDAVIFTDVTDTVTIYKAIGAYKIANTLRQQGYSCLVVDHLHAFTLEELKQIINKSVSVNTLFVGFSTTFFNSTLNSVNSDGSLTYSSTLSGVIPQGIDFQNELIHYIKTINYNCKIVVGGTKAHANINDRNIDYSIIGYGEVSTLALANHLKLNTPIPNSYKNLHGVTIVDNRTNEGFDFVNSRFEWQDLDVGPASVLPLEISRGCIFKCKFCSYPLNGKQNLDFIRHTDILYEELQSSYDKYKVENFYILDDTFNDNEYKLDVLLQAIKRLTFQPKFWAYTRLDLIAQNNSLIDKLYDIGLRGIYFGIETLNKRTGLIIGKGFDRDKQISTITKIRNRFDNKVLMHGSFILGLPEEPIDSMRHTFNQLMDESIPLHTFIFHGLRLSKSESVPFNSELGKNFKDYGYTEINNDVNSTTVNWINENLDHSMAIRLANEFNGAAQNSNRLYIPGQLGFSLKNLGYSDDYISNTKYKELDWTQITIRKDLYITKYKETLYNTL
jgi:radical SAM superfamily enzyme